MNHCELHLHDYYSTLDGLNSPAEYMVRAKELGMTHLAQTNHGTLMGHREFQREAKAAGIIPILGVEAYISETGRHDRTAKSKRTDGTSVYNHVILLSKDETGLKTLNKLNERAWVEGFYNKPRIDMELLEEHNEGLIVLSGCLNGLLCKAIERGDMDAAVRHAQAYKRIFGDDFYIEVQSHNPPEMNDALIAISDTFGIKKVMTSDCHYARKEDLWIEEAMLILSTNPKANNAAEFSKSQKMDMLERFNYLYPDRTMTFEEIEIYLRNHEDPEWKPWAEKHPDLFHNTMEIAGKIGTYPYHEALDLLPKPKNDSPESLLEKKARLGLKNRGLDGSPEYRQRLEEELQVIKDKKFSTYFLIVSNMINYAKAQGIMVGPGRGSAAGSLVCYALGITEVDPIKYGLLFFRFINPERNDFPDIDTDFEDRRRWEVKAYLTRQFKHVASIATINTFKGKGVIRDASRVFRVPIGDVNKTLKGVDPPVDQDFIPIWTETPQGKEFLKKYPEVLTLANQLKDRIRGTGMHAAGIVVSKEPLSNVAPIETAKDTQDPSGARIPVIGMDMKEAEKVGLIKLDALGLKTLAVLADTVKEVEKRHGKKIVLEDIDLEDKNVYKMLSDGYTKGVFQCEATPYTNLIIKMGGVWSFADLAASNALVRPGAMNTIGAEYIARKNGKVPVSYPHEVMKPFTQETYGEILYQEQVMLTMTELAGMPMATADKVRKIIGKKLDRSEFLPYEEAFVKGAMEKVSEKVARKLWKDFEAHAGYSFNKSHAVAYSMISYWCAWLKYHYPTEFMYAILKNEKDKDARTDYLIETKRLGIRVLLPHVNVSGLDFTIEDNAIRFGLSNIKYISDNIGSRLMEYRPFANYEALQQKVFEKGSGLTTRVLQALNAIGGAAFEDNPRKGDERHNFYEYLGIPAFETKALPPRVKAQFRPLDEYDENSVFPIIGMVKGIKRGTGWSRIEVVDETGSVGIFHEENTPIVPGQMYAILVANNRVARFVAMDDFKQGNSFVDFLYEESFPDVTEGFYRVVSFQSRTTKAGKKMAHVVLSDADKNMQLVMVFPQQFMKCYTKCQEGRTVMVDLAETKDGSLYIEDAS